MRADLGEAVTLEQLCDVRRLIAAVLENQPALVPEMRRRGSGNRRQGLEPRGPATEGERGLGPEFFKGRIGRGDVGWIRNDHVESLAGDRIEPGAQAPIDIRQPEVARILNR